MARIGAAAVVGTLACGLLPVGTQTAAASPARQKLCQGAFGSIEGVISNRTDRPGTRVFAEHGITNFWGPEPPEKIQPRAAAPWCVGSRFGLPAMQVDYLLPGEQVIDTRGAHYVNSAVIHFQAYYEFLTGNLKTSCSVDPHERGYHYTCETQRHASAPLDVTFVILIAASR